MKRFTFALASLALLATACGDNPPTGPGADVTAPTVMSIGPADAGTSVLLNATVTAHFSESMAAATITATSFTLKNGATVVPATVTYLDSTATLVPTALLSATTVYVASVSIAVTDTAGNALAAARTWSFTTGPAPDATAPTVTSTGPANAATNVALNATVTADFSEPMAAATITAGSFTLKNGALLIPATVTYSGTTATLAPTAALGTNITYVASVSTAATDAAGNALAAAKTWSFTTVPAPDVTAPTVLSTSPADAATNVASNVTVTADFSEPMAAATITSGSFTLKNGASVIPATVTYSGTTATLVPTANLITGTTYVASLSTVATDTAGNALAAAKTWSFTTVPAPDVTAPTVTSTSPQDAAANVVRNKRVTAVFDEAMDPTTITASTFTLMDGATPVPATVTYLDLTATLKPTAALDPNTTYVASVSTAATDAAGNALASVETWTFTTVATSITGPAPVNLGTAGNYVILGKTGVSTTGTTAVVGDIGLSPAAASFITGFDLTAPPTTFSTSALVTGKVWASDYDPPTPTILTTAVLDMQTAYTDAAGRVLPDFTEMGAGDIGGMTLVPGLYKWGTGVIVPTSVTLTGGANDIWIFQIAGDLTASNGIIVTLAGGAQAQNVFWQVAGQVTLGTTVQFSGIILSQTLISFNTGATMIGRALAQTAVTLDATAITQP